MMGPHDKSWNTALGLGLNAIAVTAPVWPCKTDTGIPSAKRHCRKRNNLVVSIMKDSDLVE